MTDELDEFRSMTIDHLTDWAEIDDAASDFDKLVAKERAILSMEELLLLIKDTEPTPVGTYVGTTPRRYRLERPGGLPLLFEGWRLAHVDSRDQMTEHQRKHRDRWSDLSIYRTTRGNWVVAQIGMTREANGFQPGALIKVCESPTEVVEALKFRSGHLTHVTLAALTDAIDADPDLAPASEEHI